MRGPLDETYPQLRLEAGDAATYGGFWNSNRSASGGEALQGGDPLKHFEVIKISHFSCSIRGTPCLWCKTASRYGNAHSIGPRSYLIGIGRSARGGRVSLYLLVRRQMRDVSCTRWQVSVSSDEPSRILPSLHKVKNT